MGRVFDFGTDSNQNFFFAPYSGGASRVEIKNGATVDTMDCTQETAKDWVNYAITIRRHRFILQKRQTYKE